MFTKEIKLKSCCAFSGHRPNSLPWGYNENDINCLKLKQILFCQIKQLTQTGYTDFLSGLAIGSDTWTAQAVLALREKNPQLKLHCILPCKNQADKWPAYAHERYRAILEQADSIVYTSRNYHKDCMLERNRFMVEKTELLLAVYDERRQRSGTSAAIRHAQKLGRKVIIIDPISLKTKKLEEI